MASRFCRPPGVTGLILAGLVLIGLVVAGCGGGSSRPSTQQLAASLEKQTHSMVFASGRKLTPRAATCIAKVLHDSAVSDAALKALVDGDKGYRPSTADTNALRGTAPQMLSCAPQLSPAG